MPFTDFERDVLEWFLSHVEDDGLRQQVRSAQLGRREHSGVGMFVHLACSAEAPPLGPGILWHVDGPFVELPILELGASTTLFCNAGKIDFLEVHTYGEFFPDSPFEFVLHDEAPPPPSGSRIASR